MPELLHPRMADVYREKAGSLCSALEDEESRTGAVVLVFARAVGRGMAVGAGGAPARSARRFAS